MEESVRAFASATSTAPHLHPHPHPHPNANPNPNPNQVHYRMQRNGEFKQPGCWALKMCPYPYP